MPVAKPPRDDKTRETRTRKVGSLAKKSPLAAFGYKVGSDGLAKDARQKLLIDFILVHDFDQSSDYLAHWGPPESGLRLGRTVAQLTVLSTMAKGSDNLERLACVADWEDDLKFLANEFEVVEVKGAEDRVRRKRR